MKSLLKTSRNTLVAIATVSMLVPSTIWAKGAPNGGGGQSHFSHGPSIQSSLNAPLRSAAGSSIGGSATINSSNGPVLAHTANNLATGAALDKSITTSNKQAKIVASASNLNGSGTLASGQSTVHSKQVMDEKGSEILTELNRALSLGDNPDESAPSDPDYPGHLGMGSDSQYGDGATMNYPKQSTPIQMSARGTSSTSSTPKVFGKASNSTTINAVVHEKTPNVQTLTNASGSDNGKNVFGRNNFATAKDVAAANIGKNAKGSTADPTPSQNDGPPIPLPSPMPKPFPSGPILSSSDENTSTTADNVTTDASATTSVTTPAVAAGADLVLEDIALTGTATLVAGPEFTIKFRNQGSTDAGKFQVGISAGFNQESKPTDPKAAVFVAGLAAGESKTITLRLSHKAMLMEDNGKGLVPYRFLRIALDLTNAIPESDKTNNKAVVERSAIETAAVK